MLLGIEKSVPFLVITVKFYIKKGNKLESKIVDSETTINKIVERAYFYQDKIAYFINVNLTKEPVE